MKILVTGATGAIGALVVDRLRALGERPRLFVRDAVKARARFGDDADLAVGDLGDASTLAPALRDVDALFLVNAGPELAARDEGAAHVAHEAGVRVVKLSSMDAREGVGTGVWHARGEAAVRASGAIFTFVQPAGFMNNALAWDAPIRASGVVRSATGDGKIAFVHPSDIADVAVAALTTRTFDGESLPLTGPVALSYAEMVETVGAALGRKLEFRPITDEQTRTEWSTRGETPESIDYHLSIFRAIREGRLASVTHVIDRVLGRPARSFERWVTENVDAFR